MIVATILAFLFLQSATTILRQALVERRVALGNQTEMVSASACTSTRIGQ